MRTTLYQDAARPDGTPSALSLQAIDTVPSISPEDFKRYYFDQRKPLIIKDLAKNWNAYYRWNWDHFRQLLGDKKVGIYNNTKSDAHAPVNKPDDYITFGEYIDLISRGPCEWRIFLFNMFRHCPQLIDDFDWPDEYMKGFVKRVPMLFTGGQGSITHMHFDMDLSHILHTQFAGRKRVLLFPYEEKDRLYRKPFEVLSQADFSHYHDPQKSKLDMQRFPAIAQARGFTAILGHGDTLFMPGGYWHHMEYIDSGFAMSLRAMQGSLAGKTQAIWNLIGMRNIDTLMKKSLPTQWYQWKERKLFANAAIAMANQNHRVGQDPEIFLDPGYKNAASL
jgi:hypothetical protein